MNDYDLIAPFYDIEHAQFDEDLNLYLDFAKSRMGPLLELACGSGRLLLPLAREGYELTGADTSAAMLSLAHQRLQGAGVASRCKLVQQDICTLHLEQQFSMAFIALGSFAHISTRKRQQQALAAVHTHLTPGAIFILDIANADARYMEHMSGQLLHQGTWQLQDGSIVTHFVSPTSSTKRHSLELTHFYDRYTQGEQVLRTVMKTHLYLFERSEMELLLEQAGFIIKDVYGDYDLSPFELDSPRMIFRVEAR
jgi:SAM-dependent methyltransferase